MGEDGKKYDLTVYLAKEEYKEVDDLIKLEAKYKKFPVKIGDDEVGTLLVASSHSSPPRWGTLFSDFVDTEQIGMNQTTGALLAIKEEGRLFLYSFGRGRHLVKTESIEPNFGLRAALNLLDPESIRSLDKSSLEAQPKQAREQSGEAVGLDFFGIDIESDLLRGITGRPRSADFGSRVSGGDPIKLSMPIRMENIKTLSGRLYAAYGDESYKNGPFSWIDHIGMVKDNDLRDDLDCLLVDRLISGDFDCLWLCAPKIIDWERVAGFKYSAGKKAVQYCDTRIEECLGEIAKNDIDVALLKRRKIIAVDDDGLQVFDDTVYRFLYAEACHNDVVYILNAGTWYAVTSDYVKRIHEQYEYINAKKYDRDLLEYDDESEGHYNERLVGSDSSQFALLDKKNILLPDAASPVEACDVYRKDKELIHVKRYGGSSVLSHLFSQGLVSGELLKMELRFRQELNQRLPPHLKIEGVEARPLPDEYTVVFAIISEQENGLSLPFFSKISLKHAVNRLEAFGYKVKLAKIPVAEMKKKTKKLAPA